MGRVERAPWPELSDRQGYGCLATGMGTSLPWHRCPAEWMLEEANTIVERWAMHAQAWETWETWEAWAAAIY